MNKEWHDVQWWLPACAICNTPSNAHFNLRGYHGWLYDNQYDLIGDDFIGVSFSTLKWNQANNEWKLERIGETSYSGTKVGSESYNSKWFEEEGTSRQICETKHYA